MKVLLLPALLMAAVLPAAAASLSFEKPLTLACQASGWQLALAKGPSKDELLTARAKVGWQGTGVLRYERLADAKAPMACALPFAAARIKKGDALSFELYPVSEAAEAVAINIHFTDGSTLIGQGAVEQRDLNYSPASNLTNRSLYPKQWNHIKVDLSRFAGKTVSALSLVAKAGKAPFHGYVDDVTIAKAATAKALTPADYVDTRRGSNANYNFSRGNTFPAVALPHGFNFWTPTTLASSNWIYQYQQSNDANNQPRLQAFALSHEPSPWMGDRQTLQIMPAMASSAPPLAPSARALAFSHHHELAKPYLYQVRFNNGISGAMTATDHAALLRFAFPAGHGQLLFDNKTDEGGLTLDPKTASISGFSDVKSGLSTGATRLFFYASFDKTVSSHGRYPHSKHAKVAGWFGFNSSEVTMRIATSLISIQQAKHNLALEISPHDSFASVKARAKAAWNKRLATVSIPGASHRDQATLYGNLYRAFLYPNRAYENTGSNAKPTYRYASPFSKPAGPDTPSHTGAKVLAGKPYVNNGFWDTYRTAWPLYALLTPQEDGQMIDGFVQQYRDGGWIARWSSPGYSDLMVGTSADVAFSDAWAKGVHNFDVKSFYQAALKDATVVSPIAGAGRKELSRSLFRGYTSSATDEGLSWSLAGYLNDFAISELAKALAKHPPANDSYARHYQDDARYFQRRALDYVTLFNPKVHFFIGKKPNGQWRVNADKFDPYAWGGDYTETNAWGMSVDAVQDGQGLANLFGGRQGLAAHLDALFNAPTTFHSGHYGGVIHEMLEAQQVRMGQYQHSNQPAHHIIYMYDMAGQPWKTQDKVRDVLNRLYSGNHNGQGYPGDEDNGEMSAWYVFSAAGFYPLRVGTSEYAIGAPYFAKMHIALENGHSLDIEAPGVSNRNRYIQSLTVNGKPYNSPWISHQLLTEGAKLVFTMGPTPSHWGANVEPPSITHGNAKPAPWVDLSDAPAAKVSLNQQSAAALSDNNSATASAIAHGAVIAVQFNKPQRVQMYTLTSASSGAMLSDWQLQASTDGKHWQTLDSRQGQHFPWPQQSRAFGIKSPAAFSQYRLLNKGAKATLAEVQWLGLAP
ncbi:GH92 family glycosyl hydrolase [Gallaecimonas mangrovi]|uniref:GH92 family glycosyl hydrolase n=1 Tax=Gallaecimonas mangrovi TaxID=2291597 RepID=UPI001D009006|nr:GH92 family glycosyl hydrolase [Gallaecimonas mangrovi]